jgi:very-short-patch-repair endonuclease
MASIQPKDRTRTLRKTATRQERLLWSRLRNRRLGGFLFHRQYQLGPYLADFYCRETRLIIELDGRHHQDVMHRYYDGFRTEYLEASGFRVLHFFNSQIDHDLAGVLETIRDVLAICPVEDGPGPAIGKGYTDRGRGMLRLVEGTRRD